MSGEGRHHFDGETYSAPDDQARLNTQLDCVLWVICDGDWHTLAGIQEAIRCETGRDFSLPGISARLRDFRKDYFGALDIERRRVDGGLWEYRLND